MVNKYVNKYLDLKHDDIHMQSIEMEERQEGYKCFEKEHKSDVAEGVNKLVELLESLKKELSE